MLIGTIDLLLTAPRVGLTAYSEFRVAGQLMDPSVSVPIESGAKPAATAIPLPEEEPPGLYWAVLEKVPNVEVGR